MSDFVPGLVLGVLLGAAVGALVVVGLARSLMRLTGSRTVPQLLRFVWVGLLPGRRRDGIAVERSMSRVLRDQYSQLASGARVAATAVTLHVSPEDHAVLAAAPGLDVAIADLAAFYVSHAGASGWQVLADPVLTVERDISLKPRQVRAQPSLRAPEPARGTPATGAGPTGERSAAADRPDRGATPARLHPAPSVTDREPVPPPDPLPSPTLVLGDAATEVLPSGAAVTEVLGLGDLVVRSGQTVHVVPRASGRAVIGRGPRCDIRVDGPGVADEHVRLEVRDDGWWVVPLAPGARTTIGGDRVQEPGRVGTIAFLGLGHLTRLELGVQPLAA